MTKKGTWIGAVFFLVAVGTVCALRVDAQLQSTPADARPAFAVSAIKPSGPASGTGVTIKLLPGGRFVARNVSLRILIKIAYDLNDDQLSGGPTWAAFKHFDIDARQDTSTADDSSTMTSSNMTNDEKQKYRDYDKLLLQGLLRDRFQLKMRSETKPMSIYALVIAKSGAKLKKSPDPGGVTQLSGSSGAIAGVNATMDGLANELGDKAGHPVQNMTGLDGKYDFKVQWTPDSSPAPDPNGLVTISDYSGLTLFAAVQQQLGLRLEPRKSPALYEAIESVQLPSEN